MRDAVSMNFALRMGENKQNNAYMARKARTSAVTKNKIRLSIIIPAYNAEPYLSELLDRLDPQMTKDVECLIIDDGSKAAVHSDYKWAKVFRQENQGCSTARNAGIDKAKGDYISFIDADDLVSEDFISKILEKTKDEPDVIELSWRSLTENMWNLQVKLQSDSDRLQNPSVCTRVFKKSFIGSVRFNVKKDSTEDEDFSRKIGFLDPDNHFKRTVIPDYMYFYRDEVPMSKTKRFAAGLMNTKRVVYFYKHVSKDMTWLLEEIKKEDETNEVFLMTYQNDIPELKRYCRIEKPHSCWGHIVKGEPYGGLTKKEPPYKTQIVIYRRNINLVGGLGTFTNNFIAELGDLYDITVVCETINGVRYRDVTRKVRVLANEIIHENGRSPIYKNQKPIYCDTLIMLSFLDELPTNINAKKVVRMCHACKTDPTWKIPKDYDELIYVSETAMRSHGEENGLVIHNMNVPVEQKALILVSATRFPAPDKGKIDQRMRKLANMLNDKGIKYLWLNFSDGNMVDPPKNFYNMGSSYNMQSIIKAADYLIALSDSECWSYSCLEALMSGTALVCTPFPSAFEMGVQDGVNAHVVPFDMDFDVTKLLTVPKFKYEYDNESIRQQWIKILGHTTPRHDYIPDELVEIKVKQEFLDIETNQYAKPGQRRMVTKQRAQEMMTNLGDKYVEIIGG